METYDISVELFFIRIEFDLRIQWNQYNVGANTLMIKNRSMREMVKEKLDYFYRATFEDLMDCVNSLNNIDFYVSMNGSDLLLNSKDKDSNGWIKMGNNIGFNATLVIPEIFEDFSCFLVLFQNAYFKQSKQILRNVLELTIQFLYADFLIKENRIPESAWLKGERGVSRIFDIANELERTSIYEIKIIREIKKIYNLLNALTHSHKKYLNIIATPRTGINEVFGIDHTEVINTKIIFLLCIQNTLKLIVSFYKNQTSDYWVDAIIKEIDDVLLKIDKHSEDIENYKKGDYEKGEGILIFRKNMKLLNSKNVLYTYKANRRIEYPSKIKGLKSEYKLIYQRIDEQLYTYSNKHKLG